MMPPPGGMPPPGMMPPPGFYPPPPPYYPPPPPPPRQRSFARAIFTTLATSVLGFSLLANVYLLLANGLLSGHGGESKVLSDGDESQKVAVVPIVNNLITNKSAEQLLACFKRVGADASVKAVVLRVDTPGGLVAPSDQMYHTIARFKAAHPAVPVVVSMGGYATSGGYYAAVAADYLVAEPTTLTVNVGVRGDSLNFAGLLQKYGVEDTSLYSEKSPYKGAGSPTRRPTTAETAYLQETIDTLDARFRDVVRDGRKGKLKAPLADVCNGKAYSADEALKLGAIDAVGYLDDACAYAATKAALSKPQVVKFEPPSSPLADLFGGGDTSRFTGGPGVNVTVPALDRKMEELLDPRPMAIYRPR